MLHSHIHSAAHQLTSLYAIPFLFFHYIYVYMFFIFQPGEFVCWLFAAAVAECVTYLIEIPFDYWCWCWWVLRWWQLLAGLNFATLRSIMPQLSLSLSLSLILFGFHIESIFFFLFCTVPKLSQLVSVGITCGKLTRIRVRVCVCVLAYATFLP